MLPARHARRTLPRGRCGHPRLLYQDRRRHARRRGQGSEELRRTGLYPRTRHLRRPRDHQGVEGRRERKPHLPQRSEEHTSELESLMRIAYAVFCKKKTKKYIIKFLIIV